MTVIAINKEDINDFFVAADKAEVTKKTAGGMKHYDVIQSADHLAAAEHLTKEWFLSNVNARLPEDKHVNRFSDRKAGAKRVWTMLMAEYEDAGIEAPTVEPVVEPKGKGKQPKAPKAPKERAPSPRDRPMWAKDIPMPYRDNTKSGSTWRLLQANPGVSFHKLAELGGRENTIADAIKHNYIAFSEQEI